MPMEHVDGEDKGKIVLFALSTCQWCRKTRLLLEELEVDFSYIYVDLLEGEERSEIIEEVKKYNPQLSFPTLVLDDGEVIVGFNEEGIREALA
ncbi:MAG: transcriptional regulator Spx [Methanobacterium sp. PtaU1.Bin097]|jgi:glutaredoxin-like protein NrdH|nr:MAG: transcriptional regulator Spx [Methanobacterium sp. PtaU1.Bin097]